MRPFLAAAAALLLTLPLAAQHRNHNQQEAEALKNQPWMKASLPATERANLVLKELTLDEKISLLHGNGMPGWGKPRANYYLGNGGAGFVVGIPRLGIPFIQMSDAAYGVRASAENGRYSTALPSNLAAAASWDPEAACDYGDLIGSELRAQGYNMTLGGGINLTREPRNGRTFEYLGEDPILAGTLVGNRIKCEQAQHVIGDIKHYAVNDQESGRNEVDSLIDKRAAPARATCSPSRSASKSATPPPSCAPTTPSMATSPAKTSSSSPTSSKKTGNSPASSSPTGAAPTAP